MVNKTTLPRLTTVQAAIDSGIDPATTPTRVMKANEWTAERQDSYYTPKTKRARPSLYGSSFKKVLASDMTMISATDDLDANEVILPLMTGVDGTPELKEPTDNTDARVWTWEPNIASAPDIYYGSFEYIERDADQPNGSITYAAHKGICTTFNIAGGTDVVGLNASYQCGRRSPKSDFTASLSAAEFIGFPSKLTTIAIFDTYAEMVAASYDAAAGLGTSPLAASYVKECSFDLTTGRMPQMRKHGVFDYDKAIAKDVTGSITTTVATTTETADLVKAEEAKKTEFRYVLLRFISDEKITDTDDPYILDVGICALHQDSSMSSRGGETDGEGTVGMNFDLESGPGPHALYIALQTDRTTF